jgi:hypothetical protein
MWTTMNLSVSSTFVTVWAFNPNCFLRDVSTSTAILPFWGVHYTLKELDESGIHATVFTRKSLHERHFNFNHAFGRGAEFWVWLKRVMLPARDLTRQRLDFKTRNRYFTELLTISRCGAEERRCRARRVSRDSHSTNWGFGGPPMSLHGNSGKCAFSSPPQGVLRSDRDRPVRICHHRKTRVTVLDTIPSVVSSTVAVPASCTLGGRSTLTWSRPGYVGCMPAYWLASNCPLTVTVTGIE